MRGIIWLYNSTDCTILYGGKKKPDPPFKTLLIRTRKYFLKYNLKKKDPLKQVKKLIKISKRIV